MFDLSKWETYSHTHRSFDFEETLSTDTIIDLKNSVNGFIEKFHEIIFIEDKSTIEQIYHHSSLPDTDKHKFKNFVPRKNSQLLAPLLVIAIPKQYDHENLCLIGELYSRLSHRAIRKGFQTGFCICYDNSSVESLLYVKEYTNKIRNLNQIPFLSVGHQLPGVPWNYQQRDIKNTVKSYKKIDLNQYIKIN